MEFHPQGRVPRTAQDLIDAPASALAGALVASIAALLLATFAWLAWAQVEEVVRAGGQVEPAGRVKVVNHPRGGRVATVHVAEGQRVSAGDLLVTFDGDLARSERAELQGRYEVRAVEVARLEAEAESGPLAVPPDLEARRPDLVDAEAKLLESRRAAHASRTQVLEQAALTRRGEIRTAAAEVGRLRNSLTLLRQQEEAVRALAERGLYPGLKLVQVERQVSDVRGEVDKAESALATAEAALAESEGELASHQDAWRSAVLQELSRAKAERDRLAEQLRAQDSIVATLAVAAPVDGIVQEIGVTAAGQAVAPNEPLMKLVPVDDAIVVEARVANRDVGRLRQGMPARLKVRAFDYQRFGTVTGTVAKVAADASPDPQTGEPVFGVTVVTDRAQLGEAPGQYPLVPGMVVDVELEVGERTVLSYLTDRIFTLGEAFTDG